MIEIAEKQVVGPVIRLHPLDNVIIARTDIAIGTRVPSENLTVRGQVPAGHKIAARQIKAGEPVMKYNVCIGFASADLAPGTYVHAHNMKFGEFDRDYAFCRDYAPLAVLPEEKQASFQGIVREDGQVGTRNFIGILSTVNCSATVVHRIAESFDEKTLKEKYPNIDGVVALSHGTGCGMEMSGEPMDLLRRTMGGYARHANFAGVLVVGLGCERNQLAGFMSEQGFAPGPRFHTFVMQETGGTRKTIEAGVAAVQEMLPGANRVKREKVLCAATSRWACSAAARTAFPRSPRTRRSGARWTCSRSTAARRSSPRRRKSTASSTRSRRARARARWARSCSSASAGGRRSTPPAATCRSTAR